MLIPECRIRQVISHWDDFNIFCTRTFAGGLGVLQPPHMNHRDVVFYLGGRARLGARVVFVVWPLCTLQYLSAGMRRGSCSHS